MIIDQRPLQGLRGSRTQDVKETKNEGRRNKEKSFVGVNSRMRWMIWEEVVEGEERKPLPPEQL